MQCTVFRLTVFVAAAVWASTVGITHLSAQPNAQAPLPEGTSPGSPPPTLPIVDPANELKGIALVEALRKGGFVLYMRHAETGILSEKCDENSVNAIGTENARKVGLAIKDLKIPIGVVRSSQPCRSSVTANLLGLGSVELTEDLNPVAPREGFDVGAARSKRLNEAPVAGKNTLLVSHMHGSRKKEEWVHLQIAEIIVFRPVANARAEPVARIPVTGWGELRKLMVDAAAR